MNLISLPQNMSPPFVAAAVTGNGNFISTKHLILPLYPSSLSSFSSCPLKLSVTNPHSLSLPLLCFAFPTHSHSHTPHFVPSTQQQEDQEEEEEEEHVIGDCLVFEDGIFDDPFLLNPNPPPPSISQHSPNSEMEPQNLIPQEWAQAVQEINLTKKERRKIAQELEFGQRIHNKNKVKSVNLGEYLKLKNEKLSQLNPLVLDDLPHFPDDKHADEVQFKTLNSSDDKHADEVQFKTLNSSDDKHADEVQFKTLNSSDNTTRVEPKNPRWAVYGRGLDDISDFFNSGNYQPNPTLDDKPPQGRNKLFTKEEKFLLNSKLPKLSRATSKKWLPLHTLAASGEFYLVNTLLRHDVDINAADQDGLTALHKAITSKKQAITNFLFRESADPFVRDKDGASLMHYAVRTASSQAIKTLLLHNVNINIQDNDGWTPLHLAVQTRRTDVVRLLLMKGANKTLKNKDGLTPLELCLYSGRDVKTYELVKLLKMLPRKQGRHEVESSQDSIR